MRDGRGGGEGRIVLTDKKVAEERCYVRKFAVVYQLVNLLEKNA